jgi:hypothetical protein
MRVDMPTFAGGEIGDDLLARSDTAKYRTALRRARNVRLLPAGGATSREGLLFAGEVHDTERRTRTIPFQFSVGQGYAMEFGHHTLRFVSRGGYVLRKELLITNITNGHPAVVSVVAHGYLDGWDVVFAGIEGMTEINGLQARVLSHTADTFEIDLDTSAFGVFTGAPDGVPGNVDGGTGGDPAPPPPPAPTDPPPPPPPFETTEPEPPIFLPGDVNVSLP